MDFDFTSDTITPMASTLLTVGATGALQLPNGTTGQEPTGVSAGALRWNTSVPQLEYYTGSAWVPLANGTGTVVTVSGTANQITASPTTGNVVLSIPSQLNVTNVNISGQLQQSVNIAVVAAGTTQGTATTLTAEFNAVVSGTGGVVLPTPLGPGYYNTIGNRSGSTITVYPATGAQIETYGTNTGIPLPNGADITFVSASTTQWGISNSYIIAGTGIGIAYANGQQTITNNIATTGYVTVAATATNQSNATTLPYTYNVVNSTLGGTAVILPTPSFVGQQVCIENRTGGNLNYYPAVGGQIENLGTNNPYGNAANGNTSFVATSTTQWYAYVSSYTNGAGISITPNSAQTNQYIFANTGVLSVAGTANQVLVNGATTAATGALTLTLPQNIATTSTPAFAGMTLTGELVYNFSGDEQLISLDTSLFRSGSWSVTPNGTLYTLVNDYSMYYTSHNTALSSTGNFLGRDDPGGCFLQSFCEAGFINTFSAVPAATGTLPVWTKTQSFNSNTGDMYIIGTLQGQAGLVDTPGTLPATTTWTDICSSAGAGSFITTYLAIASGGTTGATSTNGTTWTAQTLPASANWSSCAWNGSVFCIVANGSTTVATSATGATGTWTTGTMPSAAAWSNIQCGNNLFIAVASGPSTSAAYSANGTTWTAATLPSSQNWNAISWNGVNWVALAGGTATGAYSTNGITWTAMTMPSSATWTDLEWNGNVFCAVASGGTVAATSPDGITWTARTLPVSATWNVIAWNGFVFTAVASGTNQAATSPDGITWTTRTLSISSSWVALCSNYGLGAQFVAIASGTNVSNYLNPASAPLIVTAPTGDNSTAAASTAWVNANTVTSVAAGTGITVTGTGSGPFTGAVTVKGTGNLLNVRVITATGTYTPTTGTNSVIVEIVGGGGGGAGAPATTASQNSISAGGGGGAYAKGRFTTGFSGVTVTIGAAGTSTTGNGNNGGITSFGALMSAYGGLGATGTATVTATGNATVAVTAQSGAATGGNIVSMLGIPGTNALAFSTGTTFGATLSGGGGSTPLGAGGGATGTGVASNPGSGYGSGGSGHANSVSTAATIGGAGAPGVCIIYEYS